MVYGAQMGGVRGRPVRKHRVYARGSAHGAWDLSSTSSSCRVRWRVRTGGLSFVGSGVIGPGRAAFFACASQGYFARWFLFLLRRRVFMARMFGCVRMRRRCVLLLACIAAVPACCMRLRTTYPRMSAGAGVTTRTPIVEYKQVTIASPSEGPPAQEITVVSTYMCRMHK